MSEYSGSIKMSFINDNGNRTILSHEWDSNLGRRRMAVFEDCQAITLTTRPPRPVKKELIFAHEWMNENLVSICIKVFQIIRRSTTASNCKKNLTNWSQTEPTSLSQHWSNAWPGVLAGVVPEPEGMGLFTEVGKRLGLNEIYQIKTTVQFDVTRFL